MGVYQDSVASEVRYLVDFSDARFVVAEDQEQVDKLLEVREELGGVQRVIYYDPRGLRGYEEDILMSFEEVEELGRRLRIGTPAVYARIQDDRLRLDPRTLLPGEAEELVAAVSRALDA